MTCFFPKTQPSKTCAVWQFRKNRVMGPTSAISVQLANQMWNQGIDLCRSQKKIAKRLPPQKKMDHVFFIYIFNMIQSNLGKKNHEFWDKFHVPDVA